MKYVILQMLFGWTCRGLLLWDLLDWCMAIAEIYLLKYAFDNLKSKKKVLKKGKR